MSPRQEEKLSEAREKVTIHDTALYGKGGLLDRLSALEERIKACENATQVGRLDIAKGLLYISLASGSGAAFLKPLFDKLFEFVK